MYSCCGYLLRTAKPRQHKPNQTRQVVENLRTERPTSVEKTAKTKLTTHTDDDDDIFADMFSSSSKTKSSKAGMSKPATETVDDDVLAAEPAASAVKTTRRALQSKKASVVTNAYNIDDDDDDDIFAIKPSSITSAKSPITATGSSTQKVLLSFHL